MTGAVGSRGVVGVLATSQVKLIDNLGFRIPNSLSHDANKYLEHTKFVPNLGTGNKTPASNSVHVHTRSPQGTFQSSYVTKKGGPIVPPLHTNWPCLQRSTGLVAHSRDEEEKRIASSGSFPRRARSRPDPTLSSPTCNVLPRFHRKNTGRAWSCVIGRTDYRGYKSVSPHACHSVRQVRPGCFVHLAAT